MNYYQTDDNGYLVGEFPAEGSPLEPGVFLIPRGGVEIAPPPAGPNEIAQWVTDRWTVVPDLRGRVYWLPDRTRHEIKERGVALPAGALDAEPPKPLNEVRADKLVQLEQIRRVAIETLPPVTVAGKDFPANAEYREVVTGLARRQSAGRPLPPTVRGADGTPVALTPVLIEQIDDAIAAAVRAQWDRYWARFDAVQAATTVEEINLVEW